MADAVLDRREEVNGADGTAVNGADVTAAISRLRPKFAIEVCEELVPCSSTAVLYIFNPRTCPICDYAYRIPRCVFRASGSSGPCRRELRTVGGIISTRSRR